VSVRYRELEPSPGLRRLVHRVWFLQGAHGAGDGEFQRAMPDGRPEIVFNLAERFESRSPAGPIGQPASLLVGPTTRAVEVRPTGKVDLVGLRLQPGATPELLGVSGRELLDRMVDLDDLRSTWARGLAERLAGYVSLGDRLGLLEGILSRQALGSRADARLDAAIGLALRARGAARIGGIAALVGLSRRHLARLHGERVGIGPKVLARLGRFQRVLRELEQGRLPQWSALAQRHGYFDQAHLARDFRRFSGIPPGRYLAASREVTRHFVNGDGP
jgi:AraC-like DNA-binding protein